MTLPEIRRVVAGIVVMGGMSVAPRALNAECWTKEYPSFRGWMEEISCCGQTACCTTKWVGSTLVDQYCSS